MSAEEFWRLTWRESHLLTEAYWRKQKRDVAPMALLIQCFLNVNRDAEQHREPFSIEEVFGWLGYQAEPVAPLKRTPAEIEQTIETLHAFYSQAQHSNGRQEGQ